MAQKSLLKMFFGFESKEKREKRQRRFYSRMYPLGKEQQSWEIDMLKQIFPKSRDVDLMQFEVINVREVLLDSRLDPDDDEYTSEEVGMRVWAKSQSARFFKDDAKKIIKAMAILEDKAKTMEELPSAEEIKALAQDIKLDV